MYERERKREREKESYTEVGSDPSVEDGLVICFLMHLFVGGFADIKYKILIVEFYKKKKKRV